MTDTTHESGSGPLTEGCRLSLSTRAVVVRAGSPVVLALVFSNDGPTPVGFPRASMWFEYDYTVSSGAGQAVELTPLGQEKLRSMQEQGGTLLDVQPGGRMASTVEISGLYDMSRPGTYVITATKTVPNRAGDGFIKVASNTITVKVEEGPRGAGPR